MNKLRIIYEKGQVIGDNGIVYIKDIDGSKPRKAEFVCPKCGNHFESQIGNVKSNRILGCGCKKETENNICRYIYSGNRNEIAIEHTNQFRAKYMNILKEEPVRSLIYMMDTRAFYNPFYDLPENAQKFVRVINRRLKDAVSLYLSDHQFFRTFHIFDLDFAASALEGRYQQKGGIPMQLDIVFYVKDGVFVSEIYQLHDNMVDLHNLVSDVWNNIEQLTFKSSKIQIIKR